MRRCAVPMLLLLFLLSLASSCASTKKTVKPWNPGDTVICPHCGREFPLPEKLGAADAPQSAFPAESPKSDFPSKRIEHN